MINWRLSINKGIKIFFLVQKVHHFLLIQLFEGLQSLRKRLDSSPYLKSMIFPFSFFGQGGCGGGLSRFGSSGQVNTGFLTFFCIADAATYSSWSAAMGPALTSPSCLIPADSMFAVTVYLDIIWWVVYSVCWFFRFTLYPWELIEVTDNIFCNMIEPVLQTLLGLFFIRIGTHYGWFFIKAYEIYQYGTGIVTIKIGSDTCCI